MQLQEGGHLGWEEGGKGENMNMFVGVGNQGSSCPLVSIISGLVWFLRKGAEEAR